jgi:hypothetical protein
MTSRGRENERKEFEREPPTEKQRDTLRCSAITAPPDPQTLLQIGIAS